MQAVILAGGFGTRLAEETHLRPKPMVEIGGQPILLHIMNYLSQFGVDDFIICCGYKGYFIKEYFLNFNLHNSDLDIDLSTGQIDTLSAYKRDWRVKLVDTGDGSMTGGRLKRISSLLKGDFIFTYGDGLSDVNIDALIKFHKAHGKLATVTSVSPPGRFGSLSLGERNIVKGFEEKPVGDGGLINGGYFVLSPKVMKYISSDFTVWEKEPMENLAKDGELFAYRHEGFWRAMDTLRDKQVLEEMLAEGNAPWML